MSEYPMVPRPSLSQRRGRGLSARTLALIDTATNGHAIRLTARERRAMVGAQTYTFLKRGLRLHVQLADGGDYFAWCERISTEPPAS